MAPALRLLQGFRRMDTAFRALSPSRLLAQLSQRSCRYLGQLSSWSRTTLALSLPPVCKRPSLSHPSLPAAHRSSQKCADHTTCSTAPRCLFAFACLCTANPLVRRLFVMSRPHRTSTCRGAAIYRRRPEEGVSLDFVGRSDCLH